MKSTTEVLGMLNRKEKLELKQAVSEYKQIRNENRLYHANSELLRELISAIHEAYPHKRSHGYPVKCAANLTKVIIGRGKSH
jgi:hypothetical protein